MLNVIAGLAFDFLGRDKGLNAQTESSASAFEKLNGAIGAAGATLKGFEAASKQGRNLETSFEHDMRSRTQAAKINAFQMGLTVEQSQKLSKEATNLSMQIGTSSEAAAQALVEYQRSGEDFQKLGIKNAKDLLRITEASGINATQYREMMQDMKVAGVDSAEGFQALTGSALELGTVLGNRGAAMQGLSHTLNILKDVRAHITGEELNPEQMVDMGKSLAVTTAMFKKSNGSAEEALSSAQAFITKVFEAKGNLQKLRAGVASDLDISYEKLSITNGDFGKVFEAIAAGPEAVADSVKAMVDKLNPRDKTRGMAFIVSQLSEAFGEKQARDLVNYASSADKLSKSQLNLIRNPQQKMEDIKKLQQDLRSFDTLMEIQGQQFEARFRALGDVAVKGTKSVPTFLNATSHAYDTLAKAVERVGSENGPLGSFARTMADLHHKGVVGLFAKDLQGDAVAVGKFAGVIGDVLGGIASPLGAIKTGLWWVASIFNHALGEGKSFGQAFVEVGDRVVKAFEDLPTTIESYIDLAFKAIDDMFGSSSPMLNSTSKKASGWMDRIMKSFANYGRVADKIKKFVSDLWAGLTTNMSQEANVFSSDAGGAENIGRAIRGLIDKAVDLGSEYIVEPVKRFVGGFFAAVSGNWDGNETQTMSGSAGVALGGWVMRMGSIALDWADNELMPKVNEFITKFMDGITGNDLYPQSFGGKLGAFLKSTAETALNSLLNFLTTDLPLRLLKVLIRTSAAVATFGQSERVGTLIGSVMGSDGNSELNAKNDKLALLAQSKIDAKTAARVARSNTPDMLRSTEGMGILEQKAAAAAADAAYGRDVMAAINAMGAQFQNPEFATKSYDVQKASLEATKQLVAIVSDSHKNSGIRGNNGGGALLIPGMNPGG